MSLIAAQIVDRVNVRIGLMALVPMVLAGVATVVYWIVTERLGARQRRPVRGAAGLCGPSCCSSWRAAPSRYTHAGAIYAVFAGYLLAKVFEHYDRQIFDITGSVSGHTLKHVAAGVGGVAGGVHDLVPPARGEPRRQRAQGRAAQQPA